MSWSVWGLLTSMAEGLQRSQSTAAQQATEGFAGANPFGRASVGKNIRRRVERRAVRQVSRLLLGADRATGHTTPQLAYACLGQWRCSRYIRRMLQITHTRVIVHLGHGFLGLDHGCSTPGYPLVWIMAVSGLEKGMALAR